MEKRKRKLWTWRVRQKDEPLLARLNLAAQLTDQSATQIVRVALRKELDRLTAEFPQLVDNTAVLQQSMRRETGGA